MAQWRATRKSNTLIWAVAQSLDIKSNQYKVYKTQWALEIRETDRDIQTDKQTILYDRAS